MSSYRQQKNLTVTKEQADYIKSHNGVLSISQLSTMLGLSFNKVQNTRKLLGLVKKQIPVIPMYGEVIFDVDRFQKHFYSY